MRLFEIKVPILRTPEGTLATLLQFLKNRATMGKNDGSDIRIPTDTVMAMMSNAGQDFGYDDLENMFQQNERIKKMIKSFDSKSVVLKNKPDDLPDVKMGDQEDVAHMARRASKKRN